MTENCFVQTKPAGSWPVLPRLVLGGLPLFLLALLVSQANAGALLNRTLKSASFQTQDAMVSAVCIANTCTTPAIFTPVTNVTCPADAGKTCTYYIHLDSQVQVTPQDTGLFYLLVDNAAPAPGPTSTDGSVAWLTTDPDSNLTDYVEIKSHTVAATVTNTSSNQTHAVAVRIGCAKTTGHATCQARSGYASLEVKVFTP